MPISMDKPAAPAMDELEAVLQDMAELQAAAESLKARLTEIPATLRSQLQTHEERVAAARFLYWAFPEVRVGDIADGLLETTERELRQIIGHAPSSVTCGRCNKEIHVSSRQQLQDIRKAIASQLPRYG